MPFYDKVADLRQNRVSEKRSYEKGGYTQLNLLDELEKQKDSQWHVFEIRLNGVAKLRKELTVIGVDTFDAFHTICTDISQGAVATLEEHIWWTTQSTVCRHRQCRTNLIAYKQAYPHAKPAEVSFAVMLAMIRKDHDDERYVRNVMKIIW